MMKRPLVAVVNADMIYLEMMCDILEDEGYEGLIAHENAQAYQTIKQRQPQLVILELPFTDAEAGLMVLNKMRLDPQTAHIPVIIASTATEVLQRNEAHLRSMNCDFLPKPFELEQLVAIVKKHVPAP